MTRFSEILLALGMAELASALGIQCEVCESKWAEMEARLVSERFRRIFQTNPARAKA